MFLPCQSFENSVKPVTYMQNILWIKTPRGEHLPIKEGKMLHKRTSSTAFAAALTLGLMIAPVSQAVAQEKAAAPASPQARPTMSKICTNCHQPEAGSLRGNFDSVAYKTQSIQIKIDEATEILGFDKSLLKVLNVQPDPANPDELLRAVKKGKEVHVQFVEKDGKKFATLVVVKPALKVAPEKLINTADVEKLVAMGPEKGKYLLIDARPAPRFMEGAVPTAINIPFPAFEKMVDKLPKDKNTLIVYYCGGMT
jgi:rhodanese-like protein